MRGGSLIMGEDQGRDENDRILLFSDPELVEASANCRRLNINGTFRVNELCAVVQCFCTYWKFNMVTYLLWINAK